MSVSTSTPAVQPALYDVGGVLLEAFELAHGEIRKICEAQEELRRQVGKEKWLDAELTDQLEREHGHRFAERIASQGLRGADTVWVLVYSPPEVQDRHGGAVLLEPAVNMMNFRDGDLINVQGQIQNGGQRAAPWLLVVYRAADVNLIERAD